jgi:hypothetical protein
MTKIRRNDEDEVVGLKVMQHDVDYRFTDHGEDDKLTMKLLANQKYEDLLLSVF